MKKQIFYMLIFLSLSALISCNTMNSKKIVLNYPKATKGNVFDNYFGTKVADPYRWLEDDNSAETKAWVDAENDITKSYLDKIPFRQLMKRRLEKLWNYPKFGAPFKKGAHWYFYKNDGLQSQYVIYQMNDLNSEPKVFLDPNTFSKDGTIALAGLEFSKDGKHCAYSISKGGSDWNEIYIIDVEKNKKLEDHIQFVKFSGISWLGDGFFYGRFPEPDKGNELKAQNINNMVYFHNVGDKQAEDKLVYKDAAFPERMFSISTTEDETIMVQASEDPDFKGNALSYKKVKELDYKIIEAGFDFETSIVGNIGDTIFVKTNKDASNYKVYGIKASDPTQKHFDVIAERKDVLQSCNIFGKYLIVDYLHDAASQAFVFNSNGSLKQQISLPGIGSLSGFEGDNKSMTIFYSFNSFIIPGHTYQYDIKKNSSSLYRKSNIDFDMNNYETKQIFYKSKDGTKVPMFIVFKKGIKLDGKNPTMLYGYGGFNISLPPSFSVDRLLWLEQGGIYAQANLRGGGEYGESWHEAGTKLKKQNVFDDFIAAANYLIDQKYTSSEFLAISGRSNGGLLVGAVMTQRPDLMKVAFPGVGVLDMLRYHKFTIGYYWANDYGTSDDSIQFSNLIKYSPLHNIKQGTCYPSTLIVTADHDDRVFPAHSFKFAATMQEKQACANPILIRIDKNAGHGAGKPTDMVIQDKVDMWAFAFFEMGIFPKYRD
ncbi:MAG: S9 family peptidase [Bacteroidetes bacterium CG2_30_33_31]|nr:MAG: S9 family peptidase [Bacteroidetes bacterium CG2_30_33_31]